MPYPTLLEAFAAAQRLSDHLNEETVVIHSTADDQYRVYRGSYLVARKRNIIARITPSPTGEPPHENRQLRD